MRDLSLGQPYNEANFKEWVLEALYEIERASLEYPFLNQPTFTGPVTINGDLVANGYSLTDEWTDWTPTITAQTGTITTLGTVVARYKQIGKTVHFHLQIDITTNGTGATRIVATLPVNGRSGVQAVFAGSELNNTGLMLHAFIPAVFSSEVDRLLISNYDDSYPASDGCKLFVSGTYEAA